MSRKFFKLFSLVLLISASAFCQTTDSLIYAEGKILNAETKEPVNARVTYQSLPYGNKLGTLTNSSYSFPMFDNEKYSITVEAQGFTTAKYMLDPATADGNRKVIKDIELVVGEIKKHEVGHVMRLDNVIFPVGRARISEESFAELDVVVDMMKENKTMIIQLEGHTDYQGNARDNLKLSKERVESVRHYITSKGIAKSRVKTKAFGGTMPLSRDNTPEAHRLNRRVELRILQN
ncbi:OmpA family protein [Chryseolinea sp. H1M3-3]|uniref:OmpA family protein n=1 Tax=Chryseolinea sp. H1M3-3 TaxID=3034144 RepID=UPI0023EB6322|nr:OmpA family protein [Chryseolinea sp. H1M3-3]